MNINWKVKKDYLIALFIILILTKPSFIDQVLGFGAINMLYDILRILAMVCIPLYYLFIFKRKNLFILLVAILYAWMVLTTYLNNGDLRTIILESGNVLSYSMLADIYIRKKRETFIVALRDLLFTYILLNCVTVIIFPNGWYHLQGAVLPQNWFLGNKNIFIIYYLPYMLCVEFLRKYQNRKVNPIEYVAFLLILATTLYTGSSTSIIGICVFLAVLYIERILKKNIKCIYGLIAVAALFWIIVISGLTKYFALIIEGVFHKDLTLTVRTYVWQAALQWFEDSPVIGVGIQSSPTAQKFMFGYSHPHNMYLYYLVFGGAIALIFFSALLLLTSKRIDTSEISGIDSFAAFVWAVLIIWLADVYPRPELFFASLSVINATITIYSSKKTKNRKFRFRI